MTQIRVSVFSPDMQRLGDCIVPEEHLHDSGYIRVRKYPKLKWREVEEFPQGVEDICIETVTYSLRRGYGQYEPVYYLVCENVGDEHHLPHFRQG